MNKQQNEMIYQYILDCIDTEGYVVIFTFEDKNKELLTFLYNTFKKEYWYRENQIYYKNNIYNCFAAWVQGLPSCFNIEFENYKIIELAKKFGSLPDNPTDKQIYKILENYWNFMTVKTFQLFKKYKITTD